MEENPRAHTGEHIFYKALSGVLEGLRVQKVSFKEERRVLFCEYDGEITWGDIARAELVANGIVRENRKVTRHYGTRGEMEERFPGVRAKWDRIRDETVCVVEVAGFDVAACSGAHVSATGEIGLIYVTRLTRKGATWEIEFEVGEAALDAALRHASQARRLSALAGTSMEKTYETVLNIKDRNSLLEGRLQQTTAEVLRHMTEVAIGNIRLFEMKAGGMDRKTLVEKAGELIRQRHRVVLFASREEDMTFFVLARSMDVGLDASALLTTILSRHGGRGGGKPEFAQGLAREEAFGEIGREVRGAIEKFK